MVGEESNKTHNFKSIGKNEVLIVIIILLLGLGLRVLRIATRGISYDDAFSYFLSKNSFTAIIQGTSADTMPPLYYFVLHFISVYSNKLLLLRSVNIFINIASCLFLYLVVKNLFDKKSGYIALFFACISPFLIYHSQELRMYSLLLLGQIGYLFALIKISKNSDKKFQFGVLAILFGSIAMYSHNLAIVGLLAANLIIFVRKSRQSLITYTIIFGFILLFYLPWGINLPQQIAKVQTAFWTPSPGILELVQAILTLFGFAPMPIAWMFVVILVLFIIFSFVFLWMFHQKNSLFYTLIGIGVLPPVLLFTISYLTRPVFVPRVFIFSTFIAYVLIAKYIVENRNQFVGKLVFALMVTVSIISLPFFYQYESFPRSPFQEAVNSIRSQKRSEVLILHDNKLSFFPMKFFTPTENQVYLADPPGSQNDTLALASQDALGYLAINDLQQMKFPDEMLFIDFQETENEYYQLGFIHPNLVTLREYFGDERDITKVGDINIYYFEKSG